MQETIHRYSADVRRAYGLEVQIRVGLNSGEVVVRAIGNDLHMDYSAIGRTTHLAARMEQLAPPGSIRLTTNTLRLAEGFVRVTALGPVPVKGLTAPIDVFELVEASAIRGRLQAGTVRGLTRFVGRETELAPVQQALERSEAGHGQVVALVAEAGVGKSRLVYEVIRSHRTQGWRVLESASVSYGKATPYFPVLDLLKRYAHLDERDDLRTGEPKLLGQILTLDETLHDAIPPLLALLDALPEDSPFLVLDPPQRRQRTLTALKRLLLRESQGSLCWSFLKTCIGSTRRHRPCSTAWWRACRRYGCCCWSTTVRSIGTAGVTRRTTPSCAWIPCRQPASTPCLAPCWGRTPVWRGSSRCSSPGPQAIPSFWKRACAPWWRPAGCSVRAGAYRLAPTQASVQLPATVQAVLAARIDRLPSGEKRLCRRRR